MAETTVQSVSGT